MLRSFAITSCLAAATCLGATNSSEAGVRVYSGPNHTYVGVNAGRRYVAPVPYYAPVVTTSTVVTPVYVAPRVAPVVVTPLPARRLVVTPNRVKVQGPNGTIRIRR